MTTTGTDPAELDAHHQRRRSVKWRTEPDGMVTFTLRLPPLLAGTLIAVLTAMVMRSRPKATVGGGHASAAELEWPTMAQQYADAVDTLLDDGPGTIITEVILHVRGDGNTLDDGTPGLARNGHCRRRSLPGSFPLVALRAGPLGPGSPTTSSKPSPPARSCGP